MELVRIDQEGRALRRAGERLAVHALSERTMDDLLRVLNDAELNRLIALPAFPAVARTLAAYAGSGTDRGDEVGRELRDVPRVICAILALYLDSTPGGLTLTRLEALSDLVNAGGRARAYALITFMRFLRFIEPDPGGEDGRERRYRTTPRMRRLFHRYIQDYLGLIAPIWPEATAAKRVVDEPDGFDTFMAVFGEGLVIGAMAYMRGFNTPSPMDLYSRRRWGLAMLWAILLSAPEAQGWPPTGWFTVNVTDVARRVGVSRSHVQRLLRDSEAAGHIELDPERRVRVSQLLHDHVNAYLGLIVNCFGYFAGKTLSEVEDRAVRAATRARSGRDHQAVDHQNGPV